MLWEELSKEYRKSLKQLNSRINELTETKTNLQSESEIIQIEERLKPLRNMQRELAILSREVQRYYEKSWYRSPDYSFNARKGRGQKFMYGG